MCLLVVPPPSSLTDFNSDVRHRNSIVSTGDHVPAGDEKYNKETE